MLGPQIRWGIFGAGLICHDFCVAISTLPPAEQKVVHVGSRDLQRGKTFAETFGIEKYSDSYAKVVEDSEVDVVYIGTTNNTHKDLSILALNSGKPVLCEKPVTLNLKELDEVLECARKNNLFFMEALWTRCFPLWRNLLDDIKSKKFGEPNVLFSFFGVRNLLERDRISNPLLGGGPLMDIGVYTLNACDMVFGEYKLKELKASGHLEPSTGIDRAVCINMLFENNKSVQLQVNGDHQLSNDTKILFDDYEITIEKPFWCPEMITVKCLSTGGVEVREEKLPKGKLAIKYTKSEGLRYEAAHVRECLMTNRLESGLMSHKTSRRIMGYLDEIRKQIGTQQ